MGEPIDFIKAVRTLRNERDLTYEQARDEAIYFFTKKGWPLPYMFQPKKEGHHG